MHILFDLQIPSIPSSSRSKSSMWLLLRKPNVVQSIIFNSYSSIILYSSGYACFHIKSDVFWMTNNDLSFCIDCLFSHVLLH